MCALLKQLQEMNQKFIFLSCKLSLYLKKKKKKSELWHDVVSVFSRGLLSEKTDDSLFFVDAGPLKKPEQKGT